MGRIIRSVILFFIMFLLLGKIYAQQMDTIYIIDYWTNVGAPWNRKSGYLLNEGMKIRISTGDTVFLKAQYNDSKLNLSNWAKDDLFVEGANNLKIQTLRIIKPSTQFIQVHINAMKRMDGKYYIVDTTLNFDSNYINKPYIFINIVRSGYKVFRRIMKISNNDFAWKNNYLKPSIINSVNQSVKYEYRLPEKRLIQIK